MGTGRNKALLFLAVLPAGRLEGVWREFNYSMQDTGSILVHLVGL